MPEIIYTDGSLTRLCYRIGAHPPTIYNLKQTVTSNQAEYLALIVALMDVHARGLRSIAIFSDSELMVKQINGWDKTKNPTLLYLRDTARSLLVGIPDWTLNHVPRERNIVGRLLEGKEGELAKTARIMDYTGFGTGSVTATDLAQGRAFSLIEQADNKRGE